MRIGRSLPQQIRFSSSYGQSIKSSKLELNDDTQDSRIMVERPARKTPITQYRQKKQRSIKATVEDAKAETHPLILKHKQIKEHFRKIRQIVDRSNVEGLSKTTKEENKNIKKTEMVPNDLFTEKEIHMMEKRHEQVPIRNVMSILGKGSQRRADVRKEIAQYLEWGQTVESPRQQFKERYHIRHTSSPKFMKTQQLSFSLKEEHEEPEKTEKTLITATKMQAFFKSAQKRIDEESEVIEKRVLRQLQNRHFINSSQSKSQMFRLQGLYQAKLMKFARKILNSKGYPYVFTFNKENNQKEQQKDNKEAELRTKDKGHAGLQKYGQWLKIQRKRSIQTLNI